MTIVFILDLDGTIIGDCIYQCEIYKIYMILAKLGIKIKINEILENCYNEKSKLIRPYFSLFINKMNEYYKNPQFYIYTASEKKWALKEIGIIEKNLNIKFNRPIFTRNDCINVKEHYKKSIETIKKRIKVDEPEIIIIDDNDVYIDNNSKLIKCKNYNYKYFCNYWDYIPIEKIKNKIVLNYLSTLINSNRLNPLYQLITNKNKLEYYKWLYDKCSEITKSNKKYKKDKFWLDLTKIIINNNIININDNSIKFIKKHFVDCDYNNQCY
jgi:hypothetical protein